MQAYEVMDERLRALDTDNGTRDATIVAEYNKREFGEVWPVHWYYDTMTFFYILTGDHP